MDDKRIESRNKLIGIIVGLIVFYGVSYFVRTKFFGPPSLNKALMQAASEINKSCPMMADNMTRLDNVVAGTDKELQYNYTLISIDRATVDTNSFKKAVEPLLINNVRTMPSMKAFRDQEVTIIYSYKDKAGLFITRIVITPEKYMGT